MKRRQRQPQVGELLALEALDPAGVAVTSDGAFVRAIEVSVKNPEVMSREAKRQVAEGFGALVNRLPAGQALQFYLEATPVQLDELLDRSRRETTATAAAVARTAQDGGSRAHALRRLAEAHESSVAEFAADHAAMRLRAFVIVPHRPPARPRLPVGYHPPGAQRASDTARPEAAHRRLLRESLLHAHAVKGDLQAQDLTADLLSGPEFFELIWRRLNPGIADQGETGTPPGLEPLDTATDPSEVRQRCVELREALATSPVTVPDQRCLAVGDSLEQVLYAGSVPDATWFGWLLAALDVPRPFVLCVHVSALDRLAERRKLRARHKRVYGLNRGRLEADRPLDPDSRRQEDELDQAVDELGGPQRAKPFEVSIYQAIRQPGPNPDPVELAEAVDQASRAIANAGDVSVFSGVLRQLELWRSTLPLGLDPAHRSHSYFTRHVADTVPLIGTACGSPSGVPLGFAAPGGTVQFLNPWDPAHDNNALVINGKSGAGKTLCTVAIVSQLLAHGAQGIVVDRAGHYEFLCQLVPGARHLTLGGGTGEHTISPWDVPDPNRVAPEKVSFLLGLHALLLGDPDGGSDRFGLSTREQHVLEHAIHSTYKQAGAERRQARERDLRDQLASHAEQERKRGAIAAADVAEDLALRLGSFVEDGTHAHLVDRPTSVEADAPLVVFDTRKVPEPLAAAVIFLIGERVQDGIERRARQRTAAGLPADAMFGMSFLVLEEVWALIARAVTGRWVNEMARRSRHLALALIAVTQQLDDFRANDHGQALLRQSSMQLFFKQGADDLEVVQAACGLSEEEIRLIGRLKTVKREYSQAYWCNGTRGRGVVEMRHSAPVYWLATSDPVNDVPPRTRALQAANGDAWAALDQLAAP